jgi:hypothetical protein
MGFLDRTFCTAADHCASREGCYRYLSPALRARADLWAISCKMFDDEGLPSPWVSYADFSKICEAYKHDQG